MLPLYGMRAYPSSSSSRVLQLRPIPIHPSALPALHLVIVQLGLGNTLGLGSLDMAKARPSAEYHIEVELEGYSLRQIGDRKAKGPLEG